MGLFLSAGSAFLVAPDASDASVSSNDAGVPMIPYRLPDPHLLVRMAHHDLCCTINNANARRSCG
jgi:hypothetical protein